MAENTGSETGALDAAATAADVAADAAIEARNEAVDASTAIENANERAEQAQSLATEIMDGALETERGRRIETMERELAECRNQIADQQQSLSSLREQVAEVNGAVSTLVMAAPVPELPTQTLLSETGAPTPEVISPVAEGPLVAEAVPAQELPKPKRKHRWI